MGQSRNKLSYKTGVSNVFGQCQKHLQPWLVRCWRAGVDDGETMLGPILVAAQPGPLSPTYEWQAKCLHMLLSGTCLGFAYPAIRQFFFPPSWPLVTFHRNRGGFHGMLPAYAGFKSTWKYNLECLLCLFFFFSKGLLTRSGILVVCSFWQCYLLKWGSN